MALVLLAEVPFPQGGMEEALDAWGECFADARARLPREGALWLFARNVRDARGLVPWPFLLSERARAQGFHFKAALVRHDRFDAPEEKPFLAAHEHILHLVPSLRDYVFDKSPLREPHVYKDLEWGRRTTGSTGYHARQTTRYRPDGKDPGNVLHCARRGADGAFLGMEPYPRRDLAARLALASSAEGWVVMNNLGLTPGDVPGRRVEVLRW